MSEGRFDGMPAETGIEQPVADLPAGERIELDGKCGLGPIGLSRHANAQALQTGMRWSDRRRTLGDRHIR